MLAFQGQHVVLNLNGESGSHVISHLSSDPILLCTLFLIFFNGFAPIFPHLFSLHCRAVSLSLSGVDVHVCECGLTNYPVASSCGMLRRTGRV